VERAVSDIQHKLWQSTYQINHAHSAPAGQCRVRESDRSESHEMGGSYEMGGSSQLGGATSNSLTDVKNNLVRILVRSIIVYYNSWWAHDINRI